MDTRILPTFALAIAVLLPTSASALCAGDCRGDGEVGVDHFLVAVGGNP